MMNSENRNHNERTLLSLSPGDLVQFKRNCFYSHWGVYIGNGKIVHLAGVGDGIDDVQAGSLFSIDGRLFDKARVCVEKFWKIVGAGKADKNNTKDEDYSFRALDPDKIVNNALSTLGEVGYNVIFQNCEHFANWCRYEKKHSQQVDNLITGLGVGAACALAAGVVYAIANRSGEENENSKKEKKQKT